VFRIGIVGHRRLASSEVVEFIAGHSARILAGMQSRHSAVTGVSALAEGADTIFAETVVSRLLPLEVVRPFARYVEDFANPEARARYQRLRALAREETVLTAVERSSSAYANGMRWVQQCTHLLLCAWDGRTVGRPGGTAATARRMLKSDRPWIHLNVGTLTATAYRGAKVCPDILR